ncbi:MULTISPECIES: TIGR02206 family membrane protein [Streptococcus]
MLEKLFTPQPSFPPQLTFLHQVGLLMILALGLLTSFYCYQSRVFRSCLWLLQLVQVISLYMWYLLMDMPLSESLPFYHCRLAILVMLFSKQSSMKTYFAYLGLFGASVALLHPIFDPYPFPHITSLSYVMGHLALAINCSNYLLLEKVESHLTLSQVIRWSLLMNALILLACLVTGGNYGFMLKTPLINSHYLPLNVVLVTAVVIGAIVLLQALVTGFTIFLKAKEELEA